MKTKITVLIVLLFGMFTAGCVSNPVTGQNQLMLVSQSEELNIGQQYAPEIEKQLYGKLDDQAIQEYVNSVGQKIAKVSHQADLNFQYVVVNHEMTNAMALPGGYIYITRGMLEKLNNESQLAGILAHETVHVTARHSAAAMSQQIGLELLMSVMVNEDTPSSVSTIANYANQLIGLKYSRDHEYEADRYGMDYMVKAGYNPMGMIQTMEILDAEDKKGGIEFFSTHPNPENRIEMLNRNYNLKGYNYSTDGLRVGANDYQSRLLSPLQRVPLVKEPPK